MGGTRAEGQGGSTLSPRALPPVLGRLLSGSFWMALKSPLQVLIAFWTIPLTVRYIGEDAYGAYGFAWGFGFIQFLLEFGMSAALQRQVAEAWTRGDREGVRRILACGSVFYALMCTAQGAALLGIAYLAVPYAGYEGASAVLIVRLLWIQALASPFFGLSMLVASVLQAERRYDFLPRLELLVVVLRFLILAGGIAAGVDFFVIVAAQVAVQIVVILGPALRVMVGELKVVPGFRGANWVDFRALTSISTYLFLIQLSVVLADRIDTTVLGFALPEGEAGPATAIYQIVSKPFFQIRQTGWLLSYLVLPAAASLAAANDRASLDRILYDGSRLLIGLLLPVSLLAGIHAPAFLAVWMGPEYGAHAGLLRLFLIATLPIVITVLVQAAIGLGHIRPIALAALGGAIVNLPLSYALTVRMGVSGVIWGTVLTTLVSNLIIPGAYAARVLEVPLPGFLRRILGPPLAGAVALGGATFLVRGLGLVPTLEGTGRLALGVPFVFELCVGSAAYVAGYLAMPAGRRI